MAQLKQKTISVGNQRQTIALKQLENKMGRGGRWMCAIEDKDTGARLEDPFTNKSRAMSAFDRAVSDIKRGMESAATDDKDMGLGGGPLGSTDVSDIADSVYNPLEDDDLL